MLETSASAISVSKKWENVMLVTVRLRIRYNYNAHTKLASNHSGYFHKETVPHYCQTRLSMLDIDSSARLQSQDVPAVPRSTWVAEMWPFRLLWIRYKNIQCSIAYAFLLRSIHLSPSDEHWHDLPFPPFGRRPKCSF